MLSRASQSIDSNKSREAQTQLNTARSDRNELAECADSQPGLKTHRVTNSVYATSQAEGGQYADLNKYLRSIIKSTSYLNKRLGKRKPAFKSATATIEQACSDTQIQPSVIENRVSRHEDFMKLSDGFRRVFS